MTTRRFVTAPLARSGLVVVAAAAMLFASVGAASASVTSAKLEACDLVTVDELNSAYGATFAPAEATSPTSCYFHTTENQSIAVYLNLFQSPNAKAAKVQLKELSKAKEYGGGIKSKAKKVKGLGDDPRYFAFVDAGGGSSYPALLNVRVGKNIVQVSATVTDTDLNPIENKPAMIEAVKNAIANL